MTDSARRAPVVNNYLATAPDLTEAKNKAIDADIADFSQFIEDTIAIEKQRLEKLAQVDKRTASANILNIYK